MDKQNKYRNKENEKKLPKYLEVEEDIKYRILLGEWKPGEKTLSENEFCKVYGASRITIRRALSDLENEGYLYKISGKGTFIKDLQDIAEENTSIVKSFTNEMRERGMNAITISAELEVVSADSIMAGLLNVKQGEKIFQLKRIRAVNDRDIIAYSINSFPILAEFSNDSKDYYGSFYDYIAKFGIFLTSAKEYLEAMLPPEWVAKKLGIPNSDPVLKHVRVTHNSGYSFFEHNLCYYIGSKYRYYVPD